VKVVIVDDDARTRTYLSHVVARHNFTVAGEAPDGETALELIDEVHPDLVLMDREMPGIGGTEATRRAVEAHPDIKVLALTGSDESEVASEMVAAGASGYLMKGADPTSLVEALHAVAEGRAVLDERMTRTVLRDLAVQFERERRRAEALEDLDRMKSEFISVISHELRTPLTFINGAVKTMSNHWDRLPDSEKHSLLRAIEQRSDSFSRLVNQLLMVAIIQNRTLHLQDSICNLDVLAREAIQAARPKRGLRAATFDLEPVTVRADFSLLIEVVRSLVENAFEFTTGPVIIKTYEREGTGFLEVHDSGPGLDNDRLQNLLTEPFV
jgi:signal transduction histidine kinase